MEEGADVSKAEDNATSNGLAGIPTAEQAVRLAHHPARTHNRTTTQSLFGQPMVVAALVDTLTICLASVTNMVLS